MGSKNAKDTVDQLKGFKLQEDSKHKHVEQKILPSLSSVSLDNNGGQERRDIRELPAVPIHDIGTVSDEGEKPPLPPRPRKVSLSGKDNNLSKGTSQGPRGPPRPQMRTNPTTELSLMDVHMRLYGDSPRTNYKDSARSTDSGKSFRFDGPEGNLRSYPIDEADDSASTRSYVPTVEGGDAESLLGDMVGSNQLSPAWQLLNSHFETANPFDSMPSDDIEPTADFSRDFDDLGGLTTNGENEGMQGLDCSYIPISEAKLTKLCPEELLDLWRSKRKHFLILSAAGKPIYSRHGDDNLISGYIGVIQTIISFYEGAQDPLRAFIAGDASFIIMTRGPLHLVAISKLGESDSQLRVQLEALYMQILSTLTLPNLTHLFSNRPSTDLRRPLQGTEALLSALADSFTRGSPSTLLSALECLKLRKSYRQSINSIMLRSKCESLLYGLIVAGGRLVSVIRPRSHSLHPGDLQLIFNMLFEAGGVKAGEGENWVPICLPGFNKNGYLYMYVSFLDAQESSEGNNEILDRVRKRENQIAVLLISANKESFYDLRKMRDTVVKVSFCGAL